VTQSAQRVTLLEHSGALSEPQRSRPQVPPLAGRDPTAGDGDFLHQSAELDSTSKGLLAAFADSTRTCARIARGAGMRAALEFGRWTFLAPISCLNVPRAMGKRLDGRSIDIDTYAEKLREELTRSDRPSSGQLDELDVERILAFAERVLPRAADLRAQASLEPRQRLQRRLVPLRLDSFRVDRPTRSDLFFARI
jgi:hypothetical protein